MFEKAKPVWVADASRAMNGLYCFQFTFEALLPAAIQVTVAACDCYQLYCNGAFVAAGPARCAKDHYRADKLELGGFVREGKNEISVFAAGYNVNCFEYACSEPFLWLEGRADGRFLFGTDRDTVAFAVEEREQRTNRYSFQRAFTEVWHLNENYAREVMGKAPRASLPLKELPRKDILSRASEYPAYREAEGRPIGGGKMSVRAEDYKKLPVSGAAFLEPRENFLAFPNDTLTTDLYREICCMRTSEKDSSAPGGKISCGR